MFIEAICKYRLQTNVKYDINISELRICRMDEPIKEDEYILSDGRNVKVVRYILNENIIDGIVKCKYEITDNILNYKMFVLVKTTHDETEQQKIVVDEIPYKVVTYEGIYPTNMIKIVNNYIFGVSVVKGKTKKEIKKEINNKWTYGLKEETQNNNKEINRRISDEEMCGINNYKIIADDGFFYVETELLKNNSIIINKIKNKDSNHTFRSANEIFRNLIEDKDVIFEYANKKEYLTVIRTLSSKLIKSRFTNISHSYLHNQEKLYFITFCIVNNDELEITTFLLKRLFNLCKLLNWINRKTTNICAYNNTDDNAKITDDISDEISVDVTDNANNKSNDNGNANDNSNNNTECNTNNNTKCNTKENTQYNTKENTNDNTKDNINIIQKLLSLELVNSQRLLLVDKGENLLNEYKIKRYEILEILKKVFAEKSVWLKHDRDSFWVIIDVINTLGVFEWPGLVISPLEKEMKYLLAAPYKIIVSSIELFENGYDRFLKVAIADEPYRRRVETYMAEKLGLMLCGVLEMDCSFPLRLKNMPMATAVEKTILSPLKRQLKSYVYRIDRKGVFLPRVHINDENPLGLWILIYSEEIDYIKLMDEKIYLNFLLERACLDRDKTQLEMLLGCVKRGVLPYKLEDLLSVGNYDIIYRLLQRLGEIKIKKIIEVSRCENRVQSDNKIVISDKESIYNNRCQKCTNSTCCDKYTQIVAEDGAVYNLISVENILGCIENSVDKQEIIFSIRAYFDYYGLPLDKNIPGDKGEYAFEI